ncbi:MAG: hypothetical protein HQK54_14190, partial [Oligoflexales bacterium]|nr:hypothetical protein [Oligoflexales bacterium]
MKRFIALLFSVMICAGAFGKEIDFSENVAFYNISEYLMVLSYEEKGDLDISRVSAMDQTHFRNAKFASFRTLKKPLWFKFIVNNQSGRDQNLVLEERFDFAKFALYEQNEWGTFRIGKPKNSSVIMEPSYLLTVKPGTNTYYVELKSWTFLSHYLSLQTLERSNALSSQLFIIQEILHGAIFIMLCHCIILFLYFRAWILMVIAVQTFFFLLYSFVIGGRYQLKEIQSIYPVNFIENIGFVSNVPIFSLLIIFSVFVSMLLAVAAAYDLRRNDPVLHFRVLGMAALVLLLMLYSCVEQYYNVTIFTIMLVMFGYLCFRIVTDIGAGKLEVTSSVIISFIPLILFNGANLLMMDSGYSFSFLYFFWGNIVTGSIQCLFYLMVMTDLIRDEKLRIRGVNTPSEILSALHDMLTKPSILKLTDPELNGVLDVEQHYESSRMASGDLIGARYNRNHGIFFGYVIGVDGNDIISAIMSGII